MAPCIGQVEKCFEWRTTRKEQRSCGFFYVNEHCEKYRATMDIEVPINDASMGSVICYIVGWFLTAGQ